MILDQNVDESHFASTDHTIVGQAQNKSIDNKERDRIVGR